MNGRLRSWWFLLMTAALGAGGAAVAQSAAYYTGTVNMLEVWRTGNVAFTLSASGVPCNGQFIINKSDPGLNRMYAVLVAAKAAGTNVRVYFDFCGAAEGYGGSYAGVAYVYME